jgi:hypothetical protein
MRQLVLLVLNSISFLLALLLNYLTGTGALNNTSVGEISDRYFNLFTPAGYAFAIWGVIYLLLFAFIGYQWFAWLKKRDDEYINATGIWFIVSNIANGAWIIAWTSDRIGLSLFLIMLLLVSLVVLMFRLRLEIWDAPVRIIAFVWWPVCIYLGWIIVATMANLASYSVSLNSAGSFALQEGWVAVMIVFAAIVYSLLIYFRNMREAAIVGVWALVAIAVNHWNEAKIVAYAALIASALLLIYSGVHAYRNRETSPGKKIRRGEI